MSDRFELSRRELLKLSGLGSAALAPLGLGARLAQAKPESADAKLPQVPRRVLGKTKASIPILLIGAAMKLDQRFDPKLAEGFRFGVNYIDTADCYAGGTSEIAVASFHKRMKNRDKLWITSKSDQHEPEGFEKTLAASLKKLQTSYVDMFYLHALQDEEYLSSALAKVVERLKSGGKMKHFGFSCHHGNVAELLQRAAKLPWVDSIMFRYNFRQYGDKALNKAMDAAHKAGVGLIAMKTQGSEASFQAGWKKFQKKGRWTKHQAVLKAVWADERITAAVSHMDNFQKLRQNVAAALDKEKLSEIELKALDAYAQSTRSFACDGCEHLCNRAVDVPVQIGTTLRYLMYHEVYGEKEKAQALFRALPKAAQRLSGVDFAPADQACPHGVNITAQLDRAARVFRA